MLLLKYFQVKGFITVLIITFLILILPENCLISQDLSCYDNLGDCLNPGAWMTTYKDIEVDGFPGCSLRVSYKVRQCIGQTPHTTQIAYIGITILPGGNCSNLIMWLTNNGAGVTSEKATELKSTAIRQLLLIGFIGWYEAAPPAIQAMVQCGTGGYRAMSMYQKVCSKICYSIFPNGSYALTEVACNSNQGCCGITYKFCMSNGEPQITTEVTGHDVNCQVDPFLDDSFCPPGAIINQLIDCNDNCFQ